MGMASQEEYTITGGLGDKPDEELTVTGGLEDKENEPAISKSHADLPDTSAHYADWKLGEIIDGRYQVLEILGQGAMGIVYKVRHREWDLELAVKMPLPRLVANSALKARFIQEAQTWVELGFHPNIVQCWYVREFDGIPRVFIDYLDGGSLKDWMKQGRVQPGEWGKIIDLVIQACDGLGYAHEHGVEVHRDVKPGNLLMTADGELRVTDFGIAKRAGNSEEKTTLTLSSEGRQHTITMTGTDLGTPEYSAPEQWGSAKDADARADIYALGGVLFELCCGRRPFDDRSHQDSPEVLISRHLFSPAPNPQSLNRNIPGPLSQLILRCLAKEADDRPQSMSELRELLATLSHNITEKPYRRKIPQAADLRPDALNNRAVSLMDLGCRNEAVAIWKQALQLDPYHPISVYNHAILAWHESTISDATVIRRLEKAKHVNPRAALFLGFVHLERAAADLAEQEFASVLQQTESCENGSIWKHLADAQMAQKKYAEAEEVYSKALELLPKDKEILQRREMARQHSRPPHGTPLQEGVGGGFRPSGKHETPDPTPCPSQEGNHVSDIPLQEDESHLFPWRRCVWMSDGHRKGVTSLALTPDGHWLASGSKDRSIKLWEGATHTFIRNFHGHQGRISAMAIAPDGTLLVSASWDRTLRVWDLHSGECLRILKGHEDKLSAMAISPDGKFAISGSWDCTLRIWNLKNGICVRTLKGHQERIDTLAITADGQKIVSGSEDGTRRVWEFATGKCLHNFKGKWYAKFLESFEATVLALTPDGQFALSGGWDRALHFWNLNSSELLWTSRRHEEPVTALAMAPDGEHAVSGSADRTVRIWDLSTGGDVKIFRGHQDKVTAVTVTPDGEQIISGSDDATLRGWNAETGECLWAIEGFQGHHKAIDALAVLPDGNTVITGGQDSQIQHWDLADRKILRSFSAHSRGVTALLPSSEGQFLLSAGSDKHIHLWELNTGERLRSFNGHKRSVTSLAVIPDAPSFISGSSDGTLRIWNVNSAKCLQLLEGHQRTVTAVAVLSKDMAISGSDDGTMRFWNLNTAESLKVIPVPANITTLIGIPEETSILAGHADGSIQLWKIDDFKAGRPSKTGQLLREFRGHTQSVTSLALSPDKKHFVSAGQGGSLRYWELDTGRCLRTFTIRKGHCRALAVSPDGQIALSGGDDGVLRLWSLEPEAKGYTCTIQVSRQRDHKELLASQEHFEQLIDWAESAARSNKLSAAYRYVTQARSLPGYERDARSLELNSRLSIRLPRKGCRGGWLLRTIKAIGSPVQALTMTKDGRYIIAGYWDATLRLWDLGEAVCLKDYRGHTGAINATALTPDGRFLVSGSQDGDIRLWELNTGRCLREYRGHDGPVTAVSVSACGRFLLSASQDTTLRIWNPKSAACLHLYRGGKHSFLTTAIMPDSQSLIAGDADGMLRLLKLESGETLRHFRGHKGAVACLALLPDGRHILSGGEDAMLRLWNLSHNKSLATFKGHHERISSLKITSEGRFAVSASADKILRLWDLKQKKSIWTFEGHEGAIEAVAITPNSRFIISGGRDAGLRVWELDWELEG